MDVPSGSARDKSEEEKEQQYLIANNLWASVLIHYQQDQEDFCLCYGMASCLHYLNLYETADQLVKLAPELKTSPWYGTVDRLGSVVSKYAPAIGQCQIFNLKTSKKKKREMSVEEVF